MKLPKSGSVYILGTSLLFAVILLFLLCFIGRDRFMNLSSTPTMSESAMVIQAKGQKATQEFVSNNKSMPMIQIIFTSNDMAVVSLNKGINVDKSAIFKAWDKIKFLRIFVPVGYTINLRDTMKNTLASYKNPSPDYMTIPIHETKEGEKIFFSNIEVIDVPKPSLEQCKIYYNCVTEERR